MNSVLSVALTVILAVGAAADTVFLWAYGWDNGWWTTRHGRALIGQGAGIVGILGYALLKRLFGWPTIPWVQVSLYLVVALIEVGMAVAFVRTRREEWRVKHAEKKHRVQP